ncbi:MAG: glycosyltransferase family 2 protein [Chryseolinea sp.]
MSRTAIVILNYNGEDLLRRFLPLVIEHSPDATIIVADNASTDQSISLVRDHFPDVGLIQLDANYGYCGGYNRALSQVSADYYVLLNSDVEVTSHWLVPMQRRLDQDQNVAAVQPKIRSFHQRNKFEHAGAGGGLIDALGYPFCRGRIFDSVEEDHGQYDDEAEIFWSTGACMMIRASAFHKLGGFDEDYFAHMEEIDLCWKLHRQQQKVFYCGGSTVYHIGAGTLSYGHPRKVFLNFRNGLYLIFKHIPTAELLYKFPIRLLLDWIAAAKFLVSGQWRNSAAVLNAHVTFVRNLPRELKKRKKLQEAYPEYLRAGMIPRSVVFDYFLLGKRSYTQ